MDTNRLSKELREIASDKASGVSVELVDGDSLAHMRGTITGARACFFLCVCVAPSSKRARLDVCGGNLLLLFPAMMMMTSRKISPSRGNFLVLVFLAVLLRFRAFSREGRGALSLARVRFSGPLSLSLSLAYRRLAFLTREKKYV